MDDGKRCLSQRQFGWAVGVGAVVSGSPVFIITRVLEHSTAFVQIMCRSLFFLFTVVVAALIKWRRPDVALFHFRSLRVKGAVGCFFLAAQSVAIICALLLTKASNVAFLINTSPCFCCVMDCFYLKEKVPRRTIGMIIFGLISVAVIVGGDVVFQPENVGGNLVALINPVSWAFFWATQREDAKAATGRQYPAGAVSSKWDRLLAIQIVVGFLLLCVSVPISFLGTGTMGVSTVQTGDMIFYGILGGICLPVCISMFSLAPSYISTSEMGCIKMLEVVLVPVLVYLYNGEVPNTTTYIGGSLLILTMTVHTALAMRDGAVRDEKKDLVVSKEQAL
jgi:drug/metabolite transporter (DMT)-like permease